MAIACLSSNRASANDPEQLVIKFSDLTQQWTLLSYDISTYDGLKRYCADPAFRAHVLAVLNDIHSYDSLLYERVALKARFGANHEMKKVLHQIEAFEEKYKASNFSQMLRNECMDQRELERNEEALRNDIGASSYDSQVLVLEAHLEKYVKHITVLMEHINKHIHHLHIE